MIAIFGLAVLLPAGDDGRNARFDAGHPLLRFEGPCQAAYRTSLAVEQFPEVVPKP